MIGALVLPMFWACSADGRGAVPLPKPRPADAPGVQDSRGGPREKNNLPEDGRPEAESGEGEPAADDQKASSKAGRKAADQKAAEPKPSACRLALTEAIAIAPSIPPIHGPGACGGEDLVRLEAVVLSGGKRVPMKPAAILRCTMASAVADWVRTDVADLATRLGSPLSEVDNFDSFECRGRNRINGAKLSEHGRANALDVRGVKLASGKFISLTDRAEPREVREQVLQSVCKRFSTVLGPGSDWYHEDHIHLDLAERRSGYRICQWNVYDPLPAVAPLLPAERPDEAPPREVAGAEHPPAGAQQAPAQQQPAAQAAEPEATEPEPAPPAAKPNAKAAKSRAAKSKTPQAAPVPVPAESKSSQSKSSQPKSSQPKPSQPAPAEPQPAEPGAADANTAEPQSATQPEATPKAEPKPAAKSPPAPAKKKRKHRRQQPSFFGLPLPKF